MSNEKNFKSFCYSRSEQLAPKNPCLHSQKPVDKHFPPFKHVNTPPERHPLSKYCKIYKHRLKKLGF